MCKMYNFTKLKQRCKCGKFIKKEENERRNCANKTNVHYSFTICMYFVHKYLILYNQFERTYTEDVVMTPLHIKFFHNNRPGSYCRGTPRFRAYLKSIPAISTLWSVLKKAFLQSARSGACLKKAFCKICVTICGRICLNMPLFKRQILNSDA